MGAGKQGYVFQKAVIAHVAFVFQVGFLSRAGFLFQRSFLQGTVLLPPDVPLPEDLPLPKGEPLAAVTGLEKQLQARGDILPKRLMGEKEESFCISRSRGEKC
jgi:hypothetical protein